MIVRGYHVRKEKPPNPNGISVTEKGVEKKGSANLHGISR